MSGARAVPVVLRQRGGVEILAFRHPQAGLQIVKGRIEAGESVGDAALRELAEEAGIAGARASGSYGTMQTADGDTWHFVRVAVGEVAESWTHRCADDGGHNYAFFWHPLLPAGDDGPDWHPPFLQALGHLRAELG